MVAEKNGFLSWLATHFKWLLCFIAVCVFAGAGLVIFSKNKEDEIQRRVTEILNAKNAKSEKQIHNEQEANVPQEEPIVLSFKIDIDKAYDVVGPGGSTIRKIQKDFGVSIGMHEDIYKDEVQVNVSSPDAAKANEAKEYILKLERGAKVGDVYTGVVEKVRDFGAFVNIFPGKDGLLHISQIADERIDDINNYLKVGETVQVEVVRIDQQGRIMLSLKKRD